MIAHIQGLTFGSTYLTKYISHFGKMRNSVSQENHLAPYTAHCKLGQIFGIKPISLET